MYNVAFVYTKETGGYEGVITWIPFNSEEDFNIYFNESKRKQQRVVEKGVTKERCVELAMQTPAACRIAAALEEAKMPGGKVDNDILQHELMKVAFALAQRT